MFRCPSYSIEHRYCDIELHITVNNKERKVEKYYRHITYGVGLVWHVQINKYNLKIIEVVSRNLQFFCIIKYFYVEIIQRVEYEQLILNRLIRFRVIVI